MLTARQKELRKNSLGASDMAAILGISRYKSAYDIWLEKTGRVPDTFDETSQAIDAGNRFERAVVSWAQQTLGPLRRNVYMVAGNGAPIHALLDARVVQNGRPVEAKTAGLFSPLSEEWGEPGSDQVPDVYMIQMQTQLICTKAEMGHLAAFLGGRGFMMFDIDKNSDLQDIILERGAEFWEKHVRGDTPPEDSLPSNDLSQVRNRLPQKVVGVTDEIIYNWLRAKDALKIAQEQEETAQKMVYAALGDAEASLESDIGSVTCFEQGAPGTKLDEARMKVEAPKVYERFLKPPATIRVLRYRKPKQRSRA